MLDWNIGADHDSDEVVALKQQLASKDNACGTAQSELLKKSAELEEMRTTLDETVYKLRLEADKALHYERESTRYSDNLRTEQVQRENAELSLATARDQIKTREQETLELQNTIYMLSNNAESSKSSYSSMERETAKLRSRIQDLEANLQLAAQSSTTRHPPRPSPVFHPPEAVVSRRLADLQDTLRRRESDFAAANEKLRAVQAELAQAENENIASQRRYQKELDEIRSTLEDATDELEYLRAQSSGDDARAREEELLKRVEEEEAKVEALNLMIRQSEGGARKVQRAEEALRECERRLAVATRKVSNMEAAEVELVKEREEALDELDSERRQSEALRSKIDELVGEKRRVEAEVDGMRSEIDALQSRHLSVQGASPATSDQVDPETIQRLLRAVDRLRGERNDLQRSVEFLTLESQCSQEALAKQQEIASAERGEHTGVVEQLQNQVRDLKAMLESSSAHPTTSPPTMLSPLHCGLAARALAVVINRLQTRTETVDAQLTRQAALLASTQEQLDDAREASRAKDAQLQTHVGELQTMQAHYDDLKSQLAQLQSEAKEQQRAHEGTHRALLDAETQLAEALQSLDVAESQRVALNLQVYDLTSAYRESQDTLDAVQSQLSGAYKVLEDVESQRDSLNLQVTNLEMDLEGAKEELAEGEQRYNMLQTQQLATMSTNEVTKTLKTKIELLEGKVDRRTEQIGVHQHEIKRFETNLRLSDERISELSLELETMTAEKEAMIEDCAAAREARDDALQKMENLEMELETWEGKMEVLERNAKQVNGERSAELTAMVGVVASMAVRARRFGTTAKASLTASAAEVVGLSRALRAADENATRLSEAVASAETQREEATRQAENSSMQLHALELLASRDVETQQRLVTALAVSHLQYSGEARRLSELQKIEALSQAQISALYGQVDARTADLAEVRSELKTISTVHSEEQQDREALLVRESTLSQQLLMVQRELLTVQHELSAIKANRNEAISDLANSKAELQRILEVNDEYLRNTHCLEKQLDDLQSQHEQRLEELQAQLLSAREEYRRNGDVNSTLVSDHQKATDQWARAKEDLEHRLTELSNKANVSERLDHQLVKLRSQHSESLNALERQLEAAIEDARVSVEARMEIEQASQQAVRELRSQLEVTSQEIGSLRSALMVEQQARSKIEEGHSLARQVLQQRCDTAEATQSHLRDEVTIVEKRLTQAIEDLASSRQEEEEMHGRYANLQNELQQIESLRHTLEAQARERERELASSRQELETLRCTSSETRQRVQHLEVQISAQAADHAQATGKLRQGLAEPESQTASSEALADLQEQYDDLLQRLQVMTEEQMHADDLLTDFAKGKKSLEAKVSSLNRKVQKLQAKLDAAVANAAITSSTATPVPATSAPTSSSTSAPSPALAPRARARVSQELPELPPVAGPSSGTKRKIIETVLTHDPPAQVQTPEAPLATTSTIGVKRRVPDDFEDGDGVPAQGFTAESLPSGNVSSTPRARSHAQPLRSGFTPVRHPLPNTKTRQTSPVRRTAPSSATISDVTNSPRGPSASRGDGVKRGWLGKVRSGQAAAARGVSHKRQQVEDSS